MSDQSLAFHTVLQVYPRPLSAAAVPPLNILSVHYPDFSGPITYANGSQPTLFGALGEELLV